MAINLRSVTGELQQKLKIRAAEEAVTIESLCVRFLWWGLDRMDQVPTAHDMTVDPGKSLGDPSKVGVATNAKPTEFKRVANQIDALIESRSHDPKTCRVYGCLQCKGKKRGGE